ncbi:DNA polymerase III subunit alpha, partial [Candidatus Babeliales bacterium]|nr:DNA polymerase III subunit alpha [Candidatus Babeliales bacterium]
EDVKIKNVENKYYHIILLVQNEVGYKNLCKLISYSFREGFYFKPRIDYRALKQYSDGLIVLSGCLGGHIPQLFKNGEDEKVHKLVDWFLRIFGKDRFYLEVQPEDQEEQKIINQKLFQLAKDRDLNLVATADCHYVNAEDREAHEVMLSVQTHGKITDPKRYTFGNCRVHLRTTEQMLESFKEHPEAVWNTGKIADRCNFEFEMDTLHFPTFAIPEGETEESFFRKECQKGLQKLADKKLIDTEKITEYQDRLNLEMDLIIKMGYIGYFLVVGDFIQWAKRQKIPVGPGRGSAAGALVAWALEITNIDPLKYNLLFERFLNPERVSMPDIDIDFCIEGREKVIDYVRDKYGHENVCQIITFGTMMAKGVLKDVARVLSIPFEDANALTSLIPNQLNITLKEAKEQEPRLQEMIDNNPQVAHLFSIAERLEGLTRHASKHAAGVVISPEPIDTVLPIYIPSKTTDIVTQYAMTELESIGFLKMDFLGLKTLTLMDRACKMIQKNHNVTIDLDLIALDDQKTFQLFCAGKTSGIFQFESSGLKEVIMKLQPDKFEDIIALNALYRPGPLGSGMIDDFIERRHGRQKVTYVLPQLESILEETYGVIVYQEQVMKIASAVAGYSLGEADILRRAMGKKKVEVMVEQQKIFVEKATLLQVDAKKSTELFDLMAYFAGYGFNKSHAAAYALLTYQTAYLKAQYPAEFMAALISLESTNAEKMAFYLEEAKSMDLDILPPDINTSEIEFSVVNGKLLFGLQGIKNVGLTALEKIIEKRAKKPFEDILEFCMEVDLRTVNKRVLEHLIWAGAFDKFAGNRAQKTEELSAILETAIEKKRAKETGQMGLFTAPQKSINGIEKFIFQPLAPWSDKVKLEKEKEVVGFYLSAHPLDSYKKQLKRFSFQSFSESFENAKKINSMRDVIISGCGLVKSKRTINTKKGDKMAFVHVEDYNSQAEIVIFPSIFKKVETWLHDFDIFIIKGTVDMSSANKCKILANEMVPLELFFQEWKELTNVTLHIPPATALPNLKEIEMLLPKGKASLHISFFENGKTLKLKTPKKVTLDEHLIEQIEKHTITITLEA